MWPDVVIPNEESAKELEEVVPDEVPSTYVKPIHTRRERRSTVGTTDRSSFSEASSSPISFHKRAKRVTGTHIIF